MTARPLLVLDDDAVAASAIAEGFIDPADVLDPRRRMWWSASDLMATDFPEPRWAVRGLLADGLTLLAGAPKVGKSWLTLGLAVAVSAGGIALDSMEVEQGEVLYLALEDHPRRMKDRLAKVLKGDDAPRQLTVAFEWNHDRIGEWLARKNKRLLIIDVLARVRAAYPPGTPQYDADYAAMRKIKALADEHELAINAVHHTRKLGSGDFLAEVSGTNGLAGGADAVMVLRRMRGGADAELHLTGRDVAEIEMALKFDPDLGMWSKLPGRPADYRLSDTREQILQYLHLRGDGTPKQVADALGLDPGNARQTLRRMDTDGQVQNTGKGRYIAVTPVTQSLTDEQGE